MPETYSTITPIAWTDEALVLLDQRLLPAEERYLRLHLAAEVVEAIVTMVVRGAPAIGIAGAYGVVFAARAAHRTQGAGWREAMQPMLRALRQARPTAVNLAWAIDRMEAAAATITGDPYEPLLHAAQQLHAQDLANNRRMGELGADWLQPNSRVLTHCNAGALATAGYGTALGVIRSAFTRGLLAQVYATETRPWLQGARLTAWELLRDGIPTCLITDGSAAHLMRTRGVDWVIVGADRVAANGDVANKIGTYALALAARAHGARLMVVAPLSTLDPATASGADIDIEERSGEEVLSFAGARVAAAGVHAYNPVFDVTPAALVDLLVTETAVIERPTRESLAGLFRA